ncbi:hypothetical protein [Rhodococcoides kyotonense]|uniref:Predicted lactoylglutathione lyase n=1 Tax=Rhodococcoides kyotonense TaxID=398843 RepID=A0A239IBV7_9NOCA|nr:hypothetical protein [Rhodococcus kyotonensis]SNS89894.1 Predicted lactoylglutathione lyase [Rhodococcus kyotonensis]
MTLSLDAITLGAHDPQIARRFYSAAVAPDVVRVADADQKPSGFQGYTVSYIVEQPTEVQTVVDAAARAGATVLKPAKKMLFGAFSGVFEAPDGSIWKVAAPTKKDTGPAAAEPKPTEIAALLGVESPKKSKAFYEALGLTTDRDYGDKYIDFAPADGAHRLGLMTRKALAKDAGVAEGSGVITNLTLEHRTGPDDIAPLLDKAKAAGATVTSEDSFTDPDGYVWVVTATS